MATPLTAHAADLHVFGPEGTPTERRAIAVVARSDGTCSPWNDVTVRATEPGVVVELGEFSGECTRWLTIRSDKPREAVQLLAEGKGVTARATVSLGSDHLLRVIAQRAGRRLFVTVPGAPSGEPLSVSARWPTGKTDLERTTAGGYVGKVPSDAPLGVIVRSSTLTGAAAVRGTRKGPEVVVLPSELAVPAGGAPRTAAFLVVSDKHGRLSRAVPLNIQSTRGRLQSLKWLRDGLAAVQLRAETNTESIDLRVRIRNGPETTNELPVVASWPLQATIEANEVATEGRSLSVRIAVQTVDGGDFTMSQVRVRCGNALVSPSAGGDAACPAIPSGKKELLVVAEAMVDGRPVPMATRRLEVKASTKRNLIRPPRQSGQSDIGPERTAGSKQRSGPFLIGVLAHGGVDSWSFPSMGATVRGLLPIANQVRLAAGARYSATNLDAQPSSPVSDELIGTRHTWDVLMGGDFALVGGWGDDSGAWSLVTRGEVGPAFVRNSATLGNDDASGEEVRLAGGAGLGPAWATDGLELQFWAGARFAASPDSATWNEAPVRFFVEVGGAFALGR